MASSYLSPGVYVEEVSGGIKPIAGVGTSTGAFVGNAEKGVTDKAVLVTNWSQFVNEFGSFSSHAYLAYGVFGFFSEGGTSCYVVRVAKDPATAAVTIKDDSGTADLFAVTARSVTSNGDGSNGSWGNNISIAIDKSSDNNDAHFKLTVKYGKSVVEIYDPLAMVTDGAVPDAATGTASSSYISLAIKDATKKPKKDDSIAYSLSGGGDGISGSDYIGSADKRNGLHAFDIIDDINIVAIPDLNGVRADILSALNYCSSRKDCFFIADAPYGVSPTDAKDFRNAAGKYSGNPFNTSYGALYYPWVDIKDPLTGAKKAVPPSGVVAGTYAHTDTVRGVHKAPAGISEGYLDSVIGIETIVTKGEHDILNPIGVNVIRSLPSGITIWGARTLSADSEWNYVNVRRLFMFLEESIDKGTQWVVFEPNDPALWGTVRRNLTAFLTRVWRDGALYGSTPDEAFFIKVDEENNPPAVRDAGQLIIEVGVAPVKPAEFVIIRISQKTLTK